MCVCFCFLSSFVIDLLLKLLRFELFICNFNTAWFNFKHIAKWTECINSFIPVYVAGVSMIQSDSFELILNSVQLSGQRERRHLNAQHTLNFSFGVVGFQISADFASSTKGHLSSPSGRTSHYHDSTTVNDPLSQYRLPKDVKVVLCILLLRRKEWWWATALPRPGIIG